MSKVLSNHLEEAVAKILNHPDHDCVVSQYYKELKNQIVNCEASYLYLNTLFFRETRNIFKEMCNNVDKIYNSMPFDYEDEILLRVAKFRNPMSFNECKRINYLEIIYHSLLISAEKGEDVDHIARQYIDIIFDELNTGLTGVEYSLEIFKSFRHIITYDYFITSLCIDEKLSMFLLDNLEGNINENQVKDIIIKCLTHKYHRKGCFSNGRLIFRRDHCISVVKNIIARWNLDLEILENTVAEGINDFLELDIEYYTTANPLTLFTEAEEIFNGVKISLREDSCYTD